MKTILVPTEQNVAMVSALDAALLLARKFDSCIEGFPLRPAVADMVAMDPDAGLAMVAVKENDAEMVRQAEETFRAFMQSHAVKQRAAIRRSPSASLSWAWNAAAPSGNDFAGSYGRVFDSSCWRAPARNGRARRWSRSNRRCSKAAVRC